VRVTAAPKTVSDRPRGHRAPLPPRKSAWRRAKHEARLVPSVVRPADRLPGVVVAVRLGEDDPPRHARVVATATSTLVVAVMAVARARTDADPGLRGCRPRLNRPSRYGRH
jgi:hypothetical protein